MQLIRTNSLIIAANAFVLQLSSCAIHPNAWEPLLKPAFAVVIALNENLTSSEKFPWMAGTDQKTSPSTLPEICTAELSKSALATCSWVETPCRISENKSCKTIDYQEFIRQ